MKYRNMFLKYYAPADGDGADGGNGGNAGSESQNQGEFSQDDVDAAIERAVNGLKAKNSELLGKLKTQSEQLKQFDGIDPDSMHAMLKQFSDEEEQKLFAAGKFEDVFNKRTEKLTGEHQKQLQAKEAEIAKIASRAEKLNQLAVNGALAAASGAAGVLPESTKAIQALAKGVFVTDENGAVVALDEEGDVIYGKDGKTPLTPAEWLESLKEEMPNLFAMPKGAGAKGGGNPSVNQGKLGGTPAERAAYLAAKYNLPNS